MIWRKDDQIYQLGFIREARGSEIKCYLYLDLILKPRKSDAIIPYFIHMYIIMSMQNALTKNTR